MRRSRFWNGCNKIGTKKTILECRVTIQEGKGVLTKTPFYIFIDLKVEKASKRGK